MKKLIYIVSVGVLMTLVACGTTGRQAGKKQKGETEQVSLSFEQRRKFDYYFLEAVRMKEQGKYDAAYELYTHCLDINPMSGAALYEISQFYMYLGQEEKGEEALKQAIRSDESNFWYKQTLAAFYEQKRNVPKAISVYENMAEQFPSRLEPLMSLVDLYSRTKSYQNVVNALNRLEELDGKSEQISMEKFRMYLLMGKQDSAFIEIENLSKEYPYDLRYQTILGDVYLNNEKYQEALDIYRHILKEEPNYAPAVLSMASYYQKTGQDSLYQLQLDTILMNDNVPSDTKMELMRQNILQSEQTTKDSTQIVALFQRILARPQQNADLAMLCAQYMITKNMKKESIPVLEQVLSLDPYHPDALEFYYYQGIAYYQQEKLDEALDVFTRGVRQINEKSDKQIASDFYAILGDIYHQKGRSEESYAAYDSSLVYNPDNIGTLNNYAYFLSVDKKHLDKAEEMSYRTVKAEPDNETYLDTYAWILFEKGRYTEARIYIEQALRNGGEKSRVIVEHCGDIYYMLGEKEKALEYWKKADAIKETEEGETPPTEEEIKRLKQKIKLKKYIE